MPLRKRCLIANYNFRYIKSNEMRINALLLVITISSFAAKAQEIDSDYDRNTDFKRANT